MNETEDIVSKLFKWTIILNMYHKKRGYSMSLQSFSEIQLKSLMLSRYIAAYRQNQINFYQKAI